MGPIGLTGRPLCSSVLELVHWSIRMSDSTVSEILLQKFTVVYGVSIVQPYVEFLVGPRIKRTSVNRSGLDSVGRTQTYSDCAYICTNNVEIS